MYVCDAKSASMQFPACQVLLVLSLLQNVMAHMKCFLQGGPSLKHVALCAVHSAETGPNVRGVQGHHGLHHVAADGGGGHHCPQDCTHPQVYQRKQNYGMHCLSLLVAVHEQLISIAVYEACHSL